jgi:hypothetical protein
MYRFNEKDISEMSGRNLIYADAARMVQDFQVFGSGAETFAPLFYFYCNQSKEWAGDVHNNCLGACITFG